MTTTFRGPVPPVVSDWLARRQALGQDRGDEVWDGRYVVAPEPHGGHEELRLSLAFLLHPAARRLGLRALSGMNLGAPADYRCPDGALVAGPPALWYDTAVLVVEVLSPEDMTFEKLPFYAAHGVQELLVLDWRQRTAQVLALQPEPHETERSEVLGLTVRGLEQQLDWPQP